MLKLLKKRFSKTVGLPPGTLVYSGEKRTTPAQITVIDYAETHLYQQEVESVEECFPFKETSTVTWINIDGIHQVEIIESMGKYFGVHPLVLEDLMNTGHRPKMEDYEDYIFIVLRMLRYNAKTAEIMDEQVSLIIGSNFVISFQEQTDGDVFEPVRLRIRNGKGRIRKMGSDYLAYALIDVIVDNYFVILERLSEAVESMEETLITDPTPDTLEQIALLKKETVSLRKSIWPLREVINGLQRGDSMLFTEDTRIFLRDVYDHTIQAIETIETFRDTVSSMLDIYLSMISYKMNEVMKVLTIMATIFIPLTFIAGVYGMNFKAMPELDWPWAYPIVLLIMVVVGVAMLIYFRRKRWL